MRKLRILIADDHEVVREGLRTILEPENLYEVAGVAADGREAVEKAIALRPDFAIVDITMPQLNGLEATRRIVHAVPETRVLILTMHKAEEMAREAFAAGALGVVLKSDAGRDLLTALDWLRRDKPFLSSRLNQAVVPTPDTPLPPRTRRTPGKLTSREIEVVQLISEGKTSKEISKTLGISIKTADAHRLHIMQKLRVHSVSELVRYAIRNKIVEA